MREEWRALRWLHPPFAKRKTRQTKEFALFSIELIQWMMILGVARTLRADWDLIKEIHMEHLQSRYKLAPLWDLKYLGVKEFTISKVDFYMSFFGDPHPTRIVNFLEGSWRRGIEPCLKVLKRKASNFQVVGLDMNTGLMGAEEHLTHMTIFFDHRHVWAFMNESVENVRNEQQSEFDEDEKQVFRGSSFPICCLPS